MSLLNSASLVVTPNGYKEGTLYSVIPNTTLGDMTVVRATTATRVNSAGLIELVPYNLLTWSEQFNNADWALSSATISINATTAPNDTLTADKFIAAATNAVHFFQQSFISSSYVFSIYAKAGEENVFSMWIANTSKRAEFNLTTGTIPLSTVANSSIVNVGNGWYRCSVYDSSPTTTYRIYGRTGSSYLGNGVDGMFFWGAQLNDGTTAKDYQKTETRLNIPRLDYSNGSCPSLLLEPQRTNLALYSEQFDNAIWTKTRLTISANTSVSPDGFTSADSVFETTDNNTHLLFQRPNVTATNPFTFSCFVKANGRRRLNLQIFDSSTLFASALFDVISGVVIATNGTSKIEDYGNGWYRCAISNVSPTTSLGYAQIGLATDTYTNANVLDSYVGDVTKGVLLYGAQFELGSYPTSYIPTTSAAVTRNADLISKTGISSLIGQTEGTLFVEMKLQNVNSASLYSGITSGSFANAILIGKEAGVSPNKLALYILANGSTILGNTSISLTSNYVKCAIAYKSGSWSAYVNGTLIDSGTSTFSFSAPFDIFGFGSNGSFTTLLDKTEVKTASLFPTRLTNAELASLTT